MTCSFAVTLRALSPATLASTTGDLIRGYVPLDDVDRPGAAKLYNQHRRAFRKRGLGPGQIGLHPSTDFDQCLPRAGRPTGTNRENAGAAYAGLVPNHQHPPARHAAKSTFPTLSGPDHDPSGRIPARCLSSRHRVPIAARRLAWCREESGTTPITRRRRTHRRAGVVGEHVADPLHRQSGATGQVPDRVERLAHESSVPSGRVLNCEVSRQGRLKSILGGVS
jgi:hypothetical protein